jgi:hypothetical protein
VNIDASRAASTPGAGNDSDPNGELSFLKKQMMVETPRQKK